jgi:GT2 family glycosyltransferase
MMRTMVPEHCSRRPTISVVMPVHNAARYLRHSLPPLLHSSGPQLLEVIVVDDGSTDRSDELARDCGARVVSGGERLGPAGARNRATREARGDIVVFVDADVVVHSDAVDRLAEAFARPETVAVFGSYDDRPADTGFGSRYMNLRHHHGHRHPSDDAQTFWSGLGAVRRNAFLAVDGFDAARFATPSVEDIDLGRRLRQAGGRIRRLPEIQGTHLKRWTLRSVIHTDILRRGLPWARMMMAYPGAFTDLNVGGRERLKAALAVTLWLSVVVATTGTGPLWVPALLLLAAAIANWQLIALFARAGGWWMALRGGLFHQVYYLYSAITYVAATLEHRLGLARPR